MDKPWVVVVWSLVTKAVEPVARRDSSDPSAVPWVSVRQVESDVVIAWELIGPFVLCSEGCIISLLEDSEATPFRVV